MSKPEAKSVSPPETAETPAAALSETPGSHGSFALGAVDRSQAESSGGFDPSSPACILPPTGSPPDDSLLITSSSSSSLAALQHSPRAGGPSLVSLASPGQARSPASSGVVSAVTVPEAARAGLNHTPPLTPPNLPSTSSTAPSASSPTPAASSTSPATDRLAGAQATADRSAAPPVGAAFGSAHFAGALPPKVSQPAAQGMKNQEASVSESICPDPSFHQAGPRRVARCQ